MTGIPVIIIKRNRDLPAMRYSIFAVLYNRKDGRIFWVE